MPYDEGLAERIREVLIERSDVIEKKMFGGLCFMVSDHMCCGILGDNLMARVGPNAYVEALRENHVREMDFSGKPMKGLVYVTPAGIEDDDDLNLWIEKSLEFVASLPPKKP